MAAGRGLKELLSRRRVEEEGEEEDGPVLVEDSQSEGSVLSELEDDEGEDSSLAEPTAQGQLSAESGHPQPDASGNGLKSKKRKPRKKASKKSKEVPVEASQSQTSFKAMADTEAMMNGLKVGDASHEQEETVDFENMGENGTSAFAPAPTNGIVGPVVDRQRRDHEDYRKKRDSDPAFIPNRGNFFMHDTRGQPNGQVPPPRGAWSGRGRGRGGANVGGPFSPAAQMAQAERAAEQPWKHDLHDTINEEPQTRARPSRLGEAQQQQNDSTHLFPRPSGLQNQVRPAVRSFDSKKQIGNVQIRILLPAMKEPIIFSDVPWHQYVRLPNHRPPLRRDKPVRISLPYRQPCYNFPAPDRSFIFIPRQMRPNQQGFHRGQYQRSIGGYGYSSRRTSMYGGSMYSGSVAPSRRSSLAGISRENAFSPVGSFVAMPQSRPVVRLPGTQPYSGMSTPIGPLSGHHTPTGMPQIHTYSLPQQPLQQGTPTTMVHQPRPQKVVSLPGMELEPFQNQLPAHINEQAQQQPPPPPMQPPPPYFSPRQQVAYPPSQPQAGTPLSGIPEQAIHAPTFQPPAYGQPQFYPAYPPPPNFYYPHGAPPNGYPAMPMYMAPAPQPFMMPQQVPAAPQSAFASPPDTVPSVVNSGDDQQQNQQQTQSQPQQVQSGMVAHESNGMVFYVPASEAQQSEHYQPAESFVPSYAMPGLPPPTPAPDSTMPYYYPPMPPPPSAGGMQEVGTAVYFPAHPQQGG